MNQVEESLVFNYLINFLGYLLKKMVCSVYTVYPRHFSLIHS